MGNFVKPGSKDAGRHLEGTVTDLKEQVSSVRNQSLRTNLRLQSIESAGMRLCAVHGNGCFSWSWTEKVSTM